MGERIRAFDWASHPLGLPADWPPALQTAMSLCLNSSFPTAIYWGAEFHVLYNDAWSVIPAERHPAALGQPARELWTDIWSVVGPQFEQVWRTGTGMAFYEEWLPIVRGGHARDTWWNYSLTALRDGAGEIRGLFNQGNEVTAVVLARRERQAEIDRLRDLFRQAPAAVALLRGPEHRFEIANDAYLALVGRSQIVGQTVGEAIPEVVGQGFVELLDRVFRSGEAYLGNGIQVKLQREPGAPPEDRVLDFIYQPVRDAAGQIDGIFVLVTDVTQRARAESQLRITNWQLGEERARLAATVEAEQRARSALRKFNEALEANVAMRTRELERTLAARSEIADRLRASFETSLLYQAYLSPDGTLLDANLASLRAIEARENDVVGLPFWDTPWFSTSPGAADTVRAMVQDAARGHAVTQVLELQLPRGARRLELSMRPVINGRGEVTGIVPEALDLTARA